jgi:[acyl-carrier-protein] S-malonyltransferase
MTDSHVMFVFPGQGSQYAGMGRDLYAQFPVARDTYDLANQVLGFDLCKLSFEDPAGEIGLTRNTQPALLTHQIACLRVFRELAGEDVAPALAAGHSLGEYTALVAAGALSFEEGLRLVRRRGELMGEHGEGGMLALTLDAATARPLADRFYCQVASCNLPDQTVVGGSDADLEALSAHVTTTLPRKRAIRLATEGAFHTYFMVTAARLFRAHLETADFRTPAFGVLSNYSGELHDADPAAIRTRLFFQLFNPVLWVNCLGTALQQGITRFVEFGGGLGQGPDPADKRPNLEGIIRKTLKARGVEATHIPAINVETLHAAATHWRR